MDELEKRYFEVVDRIPSYEVLPDTVDTLTRMSYLVLEDITVVESYIKVFINPINTETLSPTGEDIYAVYKVYSNYRSLLATVRKIKEKHDECYRLLDRPASLIPCIVVPANEDALSNYVEF